MPSPIHDLDSAHIETARVVENDTTPGDTVQVVISLPREDAQRLFPNSFDNTSTTAQSTSAHHSSPENDSPLSPPLSRTRSSAPHDPAHTEGHPDFDAAGFLETELSYTNAFHKTLSLFVEDKTFASPALRAAVVGYLESTTTTVLEILPLHDNAVPDHLKQEIENHVNLVKTVLQRGGVFAEDYLRNRLKKLAGHVPRLEAALLGRPLVESTSSRSRSSKSSHTPVIPPLSHDPYTSAQLSPEMLSANQATLTNDADAAARNNGRHQHIHDLLNAPTPGPSNSRPAAPQIAIPPPVPARGKTFVPPSLVPSQAPAPIRTDEGSPPPILAPFDPRPNPMACLFCRQRKIRCIGHKPHPCEICVKRGFVCSYDWISRRGKRKPKTQDGTPLETPQGGAPAATTESTSQTPPPSAPATAPPLPSAGAGPSPMEVGSTPQFAFAYHGVLVGPPPHGAMPPQQYLAQPPPHGPSQLPPLSAQTPEGNIPLDPSLANTTSTPPQPSQGRGRKPRPSRASGAANAKESCKFCREQDLKCDGNSPAPCLNCARRNMDCQWNDGAGPSAPSSALPRLTTLLSPSASAKAHAPALPTPSTALPTPTTENGMDMYEDAGSSSVTSMQSRKRSASAVSMDVDESTVNQEKDLPGEGPHKKQKVTHNVDGGENRPEASKPIAESPESPAFRKPSSSLGDVDDGKSRTASIADAGSP